MYSDQLDKHFYRRHHRKEVSFSETTHTGLRSDFVMTNTSTEQFHVKLEPTSTFEAKDAEMQNIPQNHHEGDYCGIELY